MTKKWYYLTAMWHRDRCAEQYQRKEEKRRKEIRRKVKEHFSSPSLSPTAVPLAHGRVWHRSGASAGGPHQQSPHRSSGWGWHFSQPLPHFPPLPTTANNSLPKIVLLLGFYSYWTINTLINVLLINFSLLFLLYSQRLKSNVLWCGLVELSMQSPISSYYAWTF